MTPDVMALAEQIKDYATLARHYIHQNAELGFEEHKTTAYIKQELTAMGVELQPLELATGAVGIIRGEKPGARVTGIRADIDALPITEQTDKPYASATPGVMHACGHDGHAAALLGTAKLLASLRGEFGGTVKVIFQPAEERLYGAQRMIEAGALEHPKVDTVIALHCWPPFQAGEVGMWPGQYMASADAFEIEVVGKGGHGCRPYQAVNPIVAASQIVTSLQNIVSSEVVTAQQAVITTCIFQAGNAFNIIPGIAKVGGTVRCLDEGVRLQLRGAIHRVVKGVTEAYGCTCRFDYTFGVPSLINDEGVTQALLSAAEEVLGKESIRELDGPVMGAEDFSNMVRQVGRGGLFRLGVTEPDGEELVLHNDRFDFNDNALLTAMAVLTRYVLDTHQ